VELLRESEENDGDLMGDGVNIAARLQSVAATGTISLSEDAYTAW
jgi:adenylate cyclase